MKAWLAMRCLKEMHTTMFPVNICVGDILGACMVFKTKKAAKEMFGKNVLLVEVKIGEKVEDGLNVNA